jgi:hypothetical protein
MPLQEDIMTETAQIIAENPFIDVEIDEDEFRQRVSILRRFRELLLQQREKFRNYLLVLEKEEEAITGGEIEKLESHVEMEKQIVKEIYAFQKVIDPLELMYSQAYPVDEREIPRLKASLDELKTTVLKHNEKNRELLHEQLKLLRQEIQSLRLPNNNKSLYAGAGVPSMVDVSA